MSKETGQPRERASLRGTTVFRGRAFKVRVVPVRTPSGRSTTREIVYHPDSVAVVVIDEKNNCLLEHQHREAAGRELLEIPAGGVERGETPDDCVRRELQEETGYFPHRIKRIGGFYSAPGFCTEFLHLYLATDLESRPLHAPDTEEISLVRVPMSRAARLISSGEIQDAKSIVGLLTVLTFYREELVP